MLVDSYDLWDAHTRRMDKIQERLHICDKCGAPILDQYLYETPRGEMCEACAAEYADELAEDYRMDLLAKWEKGAILNGC